MASTDTGKPPGHRGPGRPPRSITNFPFKTGDLVLVKWNDGMVYFAKIKRIDPKRCKCVVVFDDKSQDEAHFSQIHSVDETTTDIICIKCKKDASSSSNEIVLCDTCGIGFHQKCHNPQIPASALELDTPWNCSYCQRGVKCPFLTESLNALQNLLSDDNDSNAEEEMSTLESDVYEDPSEEGSGSYSSSTHRKKRGRKRVERATRKVAVDRRAFRGTSSLQPSRADKRRSPMSTPEAWKRKLASSETAKSRSEVDSSPAAVYSDATYSPGSTPEPTSSGPTLGIKRKKSHITISHRHKRQKRSSVESRTVSVTRFAGPISTDDSSTSTDHEAPSRDSTFSEENFRTVTSPIARETQKANAETRPRSLRVSLTFPDEVEPGTPLDKVKRLASPPHVMYTPKSTPWDDDVSKPLSLSAQAQKRSPVHAVAHSGIKSPFDDVSSSKPKKPKVSLSDNGTDVAFKASPLPRSTSNSPQDRQLSDEVFPTANQSETVPSMTVKLDLGATGSGASRAVTTGAHSSGQPKPIVDPKPILSVATQVPGKRQNPQLEMASSASSPVVTPQLNKPTDGVDSEKCRPVILTTTSNLQTPGHAEVQSGGPFEAKHIITTIKPPGPRLTDAHADTAQPRKAPPEPHILSKTITNPRAEIPTATKAPTGNPISPTQASTSKIVSETSKTRPSEESDVIITGIENAKVSSQMSVISPAQAHKMVIDGHRRAHVLNEQVKGPAVAAGTSKTTVANKTVDIQSPISSSQPKSTPSSVIVALPGHQPTPGVPVVVSPTPPAVQYKAPVPSQQVVDTPPIESGPLSGKGVQTLFCRMQDRNGQSVYVPISPQPSRPQPMHVILTNEASSQVGGASGGTPGATSTPAAVGYPAPEISTVSLPVQQTQPRVYSTAVAVAQPSAPNNGKTMAATAVSGVSTTKPYAIVNALPVSSVEQTQGARPQHTHPSIVTTKVVSSSPDVITIESPPKKSSSPTYDTPVTLKQNDTIFVHKSPHSVVAHAPSRSNIASRIVSRAVDKEEIGTITKKVSDALSTMNPEMLMSAFEDAWYKFQANEKYYKAKTKQVSPAMPVQSTHTKQRPPPNVEVLPSTSRSGLIRQMASRPRMIAPKPYSRSIASTPPATIPIVSSATPTTPVTPDYAVYTSIPQGSSLQQQQQPQVVLHPVYTLSAPAQKQKTYQVQTAGLYYPATVSASAGGNGSPQQDIQQQQQVTLIQTAAPRQAKVLHTAPPRQTSVVSQSHRQPQTAASAPRQSTVVHSAPSYQSGRSSERVRKGVITSRESRKSSKQNRHCARCGGDATYLCSGCHGEWYCGRECQLLAWDSHSDKCKA